MPLKTQNSEEKNAIRGGTLYLVATPIGNLADVSERAVKVLSEVDFIAAEDTRNTGKLLTLLGISRPMVSYHEHNKKERGAQILRRLEAGEACALVTDAGTPAVSDPGEDLVALCAAAGIPVTSLPGACAAVTALTLSGLSTAHFYFEGFLPVERAKRRERLARLATVTDTMIVYEAPHKLKSTLADLCAALSPERRAALCRELTKKNEEVLRVTLGEAAAIYAEKEPRGEYVLVIEGDKATAPKAFRAPEEAVAYYENNGLSRMDAIKAAARECGIPKSELYRLLCEKKGEK